MLLFQSVFRQSVFILLMPEKTCSTFAFVKVVTSRISNMCNTFLHSSEMVLLVKIFSIYSDKLFWGCFLKCILRNFSIYPIQFAPDKCWMNLRILRFGFLQTWQNFRHQFAKSMYPGKIPDSKMQVMLKEFRAFSPHICDSCNAITIKR